MKYRLEFEIESLPKTINQIGRMHWAVKAKEARLWATLIGLKVIAQKPSKPLKKAKLNLIRFSSSCPDSDGLVSSFKHVIDALIVNQIICDDTYSNIGMPDYAWEKAPRKKGKIRVIVSEV